MWLWWLLLITISLVSGDLQNYDFYDPNEEEITFKKSEEGFQQGIPTLLNYNTEADFARKRSISGEEQEKRQQRFHSWGGKRHGSQGIEDDDTDLEHSIHQPSGQEGSPFPHLISFLSKPDYEVYDSLSRIQNKRDRHPAFSSWGGKRNSIVINKEKRRLNYATVIQHVPLNNGITEQSRKRYPAFNSWAGKRAYYFNNWGGKREAAFNSFGEKRVPAFNSWGGKRGTGGETIPEVDDLEHKQTLYNNQEKHLVPENHCILFKPWCKDFCTDLTNLKNKKPHYFGKLAPVEWVIWIENICSTCSCSLKKNERIFWALFAFDEILSFCGNNTPDKFRICEWVKEISGENTEKSNLYIPPLCKKRYSRIDVDKNLKTHLGFGNIFLSQNSKCGSTDNHLQLRFSEPEINVSNSEDEDGGELLEQNQVQLNNWKVPKDIWYGLSSEIISPSQTNLEASRDFILYHNNQKNDRINELQRNDCCDNKEQIDHKHSTNIFKTRLGSKYQRTELPKENKYILTLTGKNNHPTTDNKDFQNEYYTKYFNGDEANYNQNSKNPIKPQLQNQKGLSNWLEKRSPIFKSWYENQVRVPTVQLSNGKRRPAFSSWGGKRSEQPVINHDLQKCIASKDETTIDRKDDFTTEAEKNLSDKDQILRKKRKIDNNYDKTLNRGKRSSGNLKKNKDITRIILQRGFAWPLMVKSFSKGVDFYAWGGKRSL